MNGRGGGGNRLGARGVLVVARPYARRAPACSGFLVGAPGPSTSKSDTGELGAGTPLRPHNAGALANRLFAGLLDDVEAQGVLGHVGRKQDLDGDGHGPA